MAAMGKQVLTAGGVITEILAGYAGTAPSKSNLDAWVNTYGLPVTSVIDPSNMPLQSLNALVRREYTYVIDLSNMKIIDRYIGSTNGTGISSAMTGMQTLLSLLGPTGG
jgi:hypothetical protein